MSVPGKRLLPGAVPLPDLPFTYQGAGLVVWQNETNYLVLFRSAFYFVDDGKRAHRVVMEYYRDGRLSSTFREPRDADIGLKLERRGQEIRGYYTPDGRTWIEVKRQPVSFPAEVQIGVSASNASPKPFQARLEDFEFTTGTPPPSK